MHKKLLVALSLVAFMGLLVMPALSGAKDTPTGDSDARTPGPTGPMPTPRVQEIIMKFAFDEFTIVPFEGAEVCYRERDVGGDPTCMVTGPLGTYSFDMSGYAYKVIDLAARKECYEPRFVTYWQPNGTIAFDFLLLRIDPDTLPPSDPCAQR